MANFKPHLFYSHEHLQHTPPVNHLENPERLEAALRHLKKDGWLSKCQLTKHRPASLDEISLAHSSSYIESLKNFCAKGGGFLNLDTYATPQSFKAAKIAAGGSLTALELSFKKPIDAFCLIRPPGHHAMSNKAMGFCLLNNVAITALWARKKGYERVAIIDWDAHHGNGLQEILFSQPILYISLHQVPLYPGTGKINETGVDEGSGYNFNFPFPPNTGPKAYLQSFEEVIIPLLQTFQPQLILVSAGFDAHQDDPLSSLKLNARTYFELSRQLKEAANHLDSSLIFSLEGGYNHQALSQSIEACLRALLEEKPPPLKSIAGAGYKGDWERVIMEVKKIAQEFWSF